MKRKLISCRRARCWLVVGWGLLVLICIDAFAQEAIDESTPSVLRTVLRAVPESSSERVARIKRVQERLAELAPTTQPTTAPADDSAQAIYDARHALYRAWEGYLAALWRAETTAARVAELSSRDEIESLAAEVAEIEAETAVLKSRAVAVMVAEEEVVEVARRLQAVDARIETLAERQAERAARLAGGFEESRQALEETLRDLRGRLAQRTTTAETLPAAATQPAQSTGDVQRERLDVEVATHELALHMLAQEQQLADLQFKADETRLTALRNLRAALQQHRAELVARQSRTRIEELEHQRSATADPVEKQRIDIELFTERVLAEYFQEADAETTPADAVAAAQQRTEEDIHLSRVFWERVLKGRTSIAGGRLRGLHRRAREQRAEFAQRRAQQVVQQAELFGRVQELQGVRDRALDRLRHMSGQLEMRAAELPAAEQAQVQAEVSRIRAHLVAQMQGVLQDVTARLETVENSLAALDKHQGYLATVTRKLYWQRIETRDAGLWQMDWTAVGAELRTLMTRLLTVSREGTEESADVDTLLFTRQHRVAEVARGLRLRIGQSWARLSVWHSVVTAVVALMAATVGAVLYRRCRRQGKAMARRMDTEYAAHLRDPEQPAPGLSGRIDLMVLNFVGDLCVPLLIFASLAATLAVFLDDALVQRLVLFVLAWLAAPLVIWRLVHHLFEAEHPQHRPLPCPDDMAHHYRWWLSSIVFVSFILLFVPVFARLAGMAYTMQSVVIELYKMLLLVLLALFLLPRKRVLGRSELDYRTWQATLAAILYPVVLVLVLGLLVLQVLGFGTLVTFVGSGVVLSAAGLMIASVLAGYVIDAIEHVEARTLQSHRRREMADSAGWRGLAASDHDDSRSRPRYLLVLIKGLIRLAAVLGAAVVVVSVWDIPVPREWLQPRMIGLGTLVLVVALILDRVVFAALFALQRSGRLPESTTTLLRRWVRGVLTVLVSLTLVALAGWNIDSVWTFLTTLLAMVAIGFVAVWSMLSNLLATLVILIWRPFNVGEQIEIQPDGLQGRVVDLNFMYTVLKTEDGGRVSVPNNLFAQKFIQRKPGVTAPKRSLAEQLEEDKPLGE